MSNILVLVVIELWYRQPRYVEWATIKENCLELLLNSKYMLFEFFSTLDFHKIKEKECKKPTSILHLTFIYILDWHFF